MRSVRAIRCRSKRSCGSTGFVRTSKRNGRTVEVRESESIFAARKAPQVAGARTAVASLWKLGDRDTQVLMQRFYENLWGKKRGRLEALRQAKSALLRGEPEQGEDAVRGPSALRERKAKAGEVPRVSVKAWPAWVLSGDWG